MSYNAFLEGLSDEQSSAARFTDDPVMALAGAGSGKTRMLVGRSLNLMRPRDEGGLGADPSSIMMVTFTNKAAREMRERITPFLEEIREQEGASYMTEPWIGTFHGLSLRILRVEASRAGLGDNFSIFDESDARSLLNEVVGEMNLPQFDADEFFRDLETAKARLLSPDFLQKGEAVISGDGEKADRWRGIMSHFKSENFIDVYGRYQAALEEQNAVDFSDLLNRVTRLFRSEPEVRDSWRSTFRHFMVDEVQDINRAQVAWLREITGGGEAMEIPSTGRRNEFADASHGMHEINTYRLRQFPRPTIAFVGDDDQSIYAFRGSEVAVMRGLSDRFPGLQTRVMGTSYRCQPSILECANTLVGHNTGRFGKELSTSPGAERFGPVRFRSMRTPADEIREIAKEAEAYLADGGNANEFAVLVRTRDIAKQVSKELRASGLPVVEGKSSDIRKTMEVKDTMSFVTALVNPDAEVPIRRIANKPSRGMGLTSMRKVGVNARSKGCSFLQELRSVMDNKVEVLPDGEAYPQRFVKSVRDFGRIMQEARSVSEKAPDAGTAIFETLRITGYLPDLYKNALKSAGLSGMEQETRDMFPREFLSRVIACASANTSREDMDNRQSELHDMDGEDLADRAGQLSEVARRIGNISLLLSEASVFDNLSSFAQESTLEMGQETVAAGIQVMTVHATKGLEYDHVRLPFWIEGVMPHGRAVQEGPEAVEEERRLAYVALTRARKTVGVSAPISVRDCPFIRQRGAEQSPFVKEMAAHGAVHFVRMKEKPPALYLQAGAPQPAEAAPAPRKASVPGAAGISEEVPEDARFPDEDPGPMPDNFVPDTSPDDDDHEVECPF